MSVRRAVAALATVACFASVGCKSMQQIGDAVSKGQVVMYNVSGTPIGTGDIWQDKGGTVHVEIATITLPAGTHGIHFHQVGKCEGGTTAFSTAGAHYNPMAMEHGLNNPKGPHAGDNDNIEIPASGVGRIHFTTNRVTLTPGPTTLLDPDGSSLVIHANPDDQMTNPSGNSGGRIACAVVLIANYAYQGAQPFYRVGA